MKRLILLAAVALVVSTAGAQMKNKTQCITEGGNSPTVVQTKSKASPSQMLSRKALGPVSQRPQARPLKLSEVSTAREMKMRDPSLPVPRVAKSPSRLAEQMPFYPRPAGMFSAILYNFEERFINSVRPFLMAKPFAEYYWSGYAENANESTNYAWDFYPETSFGGLTEGGELHYIDYQSGAYFSFRQIVGFSLLHSMPIPGESMIAVCRQIFTNCAIMSLTMQVRLSLTYKKPM